MIIQGAFIEKRKMLKGNLHTHTTRSDGKLTPEECIRLYKENGYDFLALTDHRIYNYTNFAPDCDITIIPGTEYNSERLSSMNGFHCYHTVCIGPAKEDGNGYEQDEVLPSANIAYKEEYQPYLDDIHSKNNLTIYCHPEWSSTPAYLFENQKGNIAMEIHNSESAIMCDCDGNAAYWDELLGKNIRIFGVASDDSHRAETSCKGFIMVNAENNISSILEALKEGKFYSSCGPEIYNFYVEDNKAFIECSPAAKIRLHSDGHPTKIIKSENGDLTRAEFSLKDWTGQYSYARICIIDKDGNKAFTNPIFLD